MLSKRPEDRPDAATVAAVLSGVASQPDRSGGPAFWPEPPPGREPLASDWPPLPEHGARVSVSSVQVPKPRLSELSGLPELTQAQVVADMPTDRAADELLALAKQEAARIINRCDDVLGGNLLSAIVVPGPRPADDQDDDQQKPATVRKILQMLPPNRRGPLIDHMSSIALAAVLALPPAGDIVRIIDRADAVTVVGAISEMPADKAAPLVTAMDVTRATEVLRQVGPARAADILRNISPVSRRQQLLARLPDRFQASVARYLNG
jgi:hypothetical protein